MGLSSKRSFSPWQITLLTIFAFVRDVLAVDGGDGGCCDGVCGAGVGGGGCDGGSDGGRVLVVVVEVVVTVFVVRFAPEYQQKRKQFCPPHRIGHRT